MLRTLDDLKEYAVGATDGVIGHVKDFYFDVEYQSEAISVNPRKRCSLRRRT